jgi:SAM-dependent methyltransferase
MIKSTVTMGKPPHSPNELENIYRDRFDEHLAYRNQVWQVLTAEFFSRLIPPGALVLDLGCGYGEFINNIDCATKFAMDMNPGAAKHLKSGITFIEQDCSAKWTLPDDYLDVIFTSNFFEHLPSKAAFWDTLGQARRCLKKDGILIAVGPNVRRVGGAYWDFWDHHLPLTDETVAEAFRLQGFRIEKSLAAFLPYTMVNQRAVPMLLVSLYLKLPFLWRLVGKQFLVIGRKRNGTSR